MFILEKKHGIAGYGFWFKLLEILGNTEGHFIDINHLPAFEYLQAHTYTNPDTCLEMLNLLASLEAIDPELWKNNIIWSDNFVLGLAPCYRNRAIETPVKPDNLRKKPHKEEGVPDKPRKKSVEEGEEGEEGREEITPPTPPGGKRPPKKFKTSLPPDFGISAEVKKWAEGKGHFLLEEHLEAFREWAMSTGKEYADWDATFKRAIRENWGKIGLNNKGQSIKTPAPGGKYDGIGTIYEVPD